MEEKHDDVKIGTSPRAEKASAVKRRAGSGAIVTLALWWLATLVPAHIPFSRPSTHHDQPKGHHEDTTWVDVPPNRTLTWHKCYNDTYDCARLDVPMDWQAGPSSYPRVILAVLRLPASSTSDYRGPLIFNPGGPGGSGLWALRNHGAQLQIVAGKNHDMVSFDPRGVGASVPRIACWPTEQDRALWRERDDAYDGVLDAREGYVYDAYARAGAFSRACEATMGDEGMLRHSSSTHHARDMLAILEGMGETTLKYWGFSYGTILGGVFASMYPDKVDRLLSDGNVDYKEWFYRDDTYVNFLHDTDKVLDAFFDFCHRAGPERCAFHAATPAAIKARLDALLATLRTFPVYMASASGSGSGSGSTTGPHLPELVTYAKVKQMISTALYQPMSRFRRVAEVLAGLEAGNGQPYWNYTTEDGTSPAALCAAETVPPTVPVAGPSMASNDDAYPAIACSDKEAAETGHDDEKRRLADFLAYAERVRNVSAAAGTVQISSRLACVGRTIRPAWRFPGPFGADNGTRFPILFVANMADNITPLISARNNSASFPGSALLMQRSFGHTSLAAASTCTARAIQDYFQDGKLPESGAVCDQDREPWEEAFGAGEVTARGMPQHELTLAVQELANKNWIMKFQPNI